ncbi:aminoglycoside phosphotransferase family protein [Flavobacterium filum]|uniref:phosphotransferase family protein n=1 Tax=Flavobacterium filum TaxID=370974 RepID=UPI0023F3B8F4|nr:aminoglycoside phosphotransferase family protein [Flavobacterium filum]
MEQKPLEITEIESFLHTHFKQTVSDVAPLGKGEWSQAFSFRNLDNDYVIRFGLYSDDFKKDQIAAAYTASDLPIPKVVEIGQALGRSFAISERAFGNMLDGLDEPQMVQIVPAVFQMLDAIRMTNVNSTSGYGNWNTEKIAPYSTWQEYLLDAWNDPVTSRTYGWRASLQNSPMGEAPFNKAFNVLKSLVEKCPEERYLLHTDLLHYNVLVQGSKISAVIDWGNAMYGDFLYELAGLIVWSPWYPAMQNIDWAAEALNHYKKIGLEVPNFEERLRCYEISIGLNGMSYNAFKHNWKDLELTTKRTLEIALS